MLKNILATTLSAANSLSNKVKQIKSFFYNVLLTEQCFPTNTANYQLSKELRFHLSQYHISKTVTLLNLPLTRT